eukprot:3957668-Pyramimonas_sp.AAC.1
MGTGCSDIASSPSMSCAPPKPIGFRCSELHVMLNCATAAHSQYLALDHKSHIIANTTNSGGGMLAGPKGRAVGESGELDKG